MSQSPEEDRVSAIYSAGDTIWQSAAVVIPTWNAGPILDTLLPSLARAGVPPQRLLIIDSSSRDDTVARFIAHGATVKVIPQNEFNHGGTRKLAVSLLPNARFIIFLTHDAIPVSADTFTNVLKPFIDPKIGMAYGRQFPHRGARGIESFSRLINYGPESYVRSLEDRKIYGIKTIFCSNSFSCYRREALEDVGNFPDDVYFAEDQIVAGRMLLKGWKLSYAADACVYHSHAYTIGQDFKRYFDVGVFHSQNPWLIENYGKPIDEGARIVRRELSYLASREPFAVTSCFVRAAAKLIAYKIGLNHRHLPFSWKARLAMHGSYWRKKRL